MYFQNLPMILLSQEGANKKLRDPRAEQYVVSLERLLTENTRFTLEAYQKEYDDFPIDPSQPDLFVLDELFYRNGFFLSHESLIGGGRALSHGVEATLQKRLAKDFYGLLGGSYSSARYRASDGARRNRSFDNRIILSAEGGYRPDNNWEFGLRFVFAGGAPYTPFDLDASRMIDRAVFDSTKINQFRYPDYHSLSLRVDRRFNFKSSNLITYLSVWNIYNRKNIASYYWNQFKNEPGTQYQWGIMPILGLEYEF